MRFWAQARLSLVGISVFMVIQALAISLLGMVVAVIFWQLVGVLLATLLMFCWFKLEEKMYMFVNRS